ncbi:GRIP1-associated protein 1-like isoform X1 [Lytechinus variegatus]|uniref:GRIP1-associated protein 1-like isoform X1 n=1 Tax=Lytechinus variegatus TaxID=7654 RepID=UPI001BB26CAE|nr:GRIP1-associated protein 1-like isoform X1 [Lytechinus variegatus]
MAQSLSDDEFQRMQNQLLELRTANYQLKDQSRKLENELSQLKQTSAANEKELEKANKVISKSKKARDVEALFVENDGLQLKLQSQEEDFRLQNSTLMEELSKLCTANEELEKEVSTLKKSQSANDVVDGSPSACSQNDIRRLQAENAALQKNLASTQQRYNDELNGMRQNVNMLTQACADAEERYTRLLGERPTPTGASGDQQEGEQMEEIPISTPDGTVSDQQSPVEAELNHLLNDEFEAFIEDLKLTAVTSDFDDDIEPKDPMTVLQGHAKQLKKRVSGALVRNMESFVKMVSKEEGRISRGSSFAEPNEPCDLNMSRIDDQTKEINDLQLRVDTEQEENKILKQQLQDSEQSYKAEILTLQEEIQKLSEKTKKKQESLVQLQNEKEELYAKNRKNVEELHGSVDKELESLRKENSDLKAALNRNKQNRMEAQETSKQQIRQLENTIEELKQQAANSEEVARLEEDKSILTKELANIRQAYTSTSEEANRLQNVSTSAKNQLESTQHELEELQLAQSKLSSERDELQAQFTECLAANATLGDQLSTAGKERDTLSKELQETNKIADKRKNMLDEMAIQTQTIREQHKEEVSSMTTSHQKALDDLKHELQDEKQKRKELEPLKEQITQRDVQIESLENAKGWFERRMKELEEELEGTKEKHIEDIKDLEAKHQEEISNLQGELSEKDKAIESAKIEIEGHQATIGKLEQDARDSVVDHKLGEKKRSGMLKDLQRQLRQEKKRSVKLQERLQEVLTQNSQAPQGLDALFSHHTYDDRSSRHDTSSISSLSNSGTGRDYSDFAPSPNDSMSAALSEETTELISKLTQIQQENWQLEEKVRHLEESNACMAEDLLRKSAIIEAHVMERKIIDPAKVNSSPADVKPETKGPSLRKMRELMRSSRDVEEESQREMNQKLQVMLEETITKNMHLQQDIEMLSSEVVRLSKLVGSSQSGTPSPVDDHQGKLPGGASSMATTSSSHPVSSS